MPNFSPDKSFIIEKCSSPIGDGNRYQITDGFLLTIEKCSSPIGDGNDATYTEGNNMNIEKCSSPIGDGNGGLDMLVILFDFALRNVAPR